MEWNGVVDGFVEAATQARRSLNWKPVLTLLEAAIPYNTVEYKQLMKIKQNDKISDNIIRKSCYCGYTELIQVFLNSGLSPNYIVNLPQKTLLLSAAYLGNLSMVKQLLNAGADVNCESYINETPILKAAQEGHLDVMKHLISAGADINVRSLNSDTVLDTVLKYKSCDIEDIVQHLIDSGYIRNEENAFQVFCLALTSHNVKIVQMMLEAGFYVNGTEFFIPLHTAALQCDIPIMQLLLKNGANINSTNSEGNSALHEVFTYFKDISPSSKIVESVKFLTEHGILLDSVNNYQESPLLMSIYVKAFDEAMLLINNGADLNLKTHHELLFRAIRADVPVELIECLLEHGASVTTTCDDRTALQYVTYYDWRLSNDKKLQVAKLLLIYGSDHYVKGRNGGTLLHWACKVGDVELVKYLIDYRLDVNAKNREGKKPIDIAHEFGHVVIVNIIIEYNCNKYTV